MPREITKQFIHQLKAAITAGEDVFIVEQVRDMYPADIAEIFDELKPAQASYFYKLLDIKLGAEVLVELDEDVREKFLASLTSKEIAENFIDNMDSDDAADVIAELPNKVQGEVLSLLEDTEQASDIVDLLKYDENTAGGLMATELVQVQINYTALECVKEIRKQSEVVKDMYSVYVVDGEKLVGLLSLKKLVISPVRSIVADICDTNIISVRTDMEAEEVANIMDRYDLVVLPVIDHLGRLVGRITIDDVVDVRREEETEDLQKMAGMQSLDEPYSTIPLFQMIKKRAGWLIILFLGETLTATAMSFFEGQIEKAVILALFVPLIISSGGNTGSQAATLIIRALALGEVKITDWWTIVKREFAVGLTLGIMLGIIGFFRVAAWSYFIESYGPHWYLIACTVGTSLIGVVCWGTLVGSILPLGLKRLGLDPAVSSTPFVATLVDVTGIIIYFSFALLFLKGVLL